MKREARRAFGWLRHAAAQGRTPRVVDAVLQERLTYLERGALTELHQTVAAIEGSRLPGILVEAGTALGGSAITMASAKDARRVLRLFDTFGMIPPPGPKDGEDVHKRYDEISSGRSGGIGGDTYYGYRTDLLREVTESFQRHRLPVAENSIEMVPGKYEDTLSLCEPVALAHIDCDWYDSVRCCLQRVAPWVVPGGRMIIDDYDSWSGCRDAVDEFMADPSNSGEFIFERRTRAHLVRRHRGATP